MKPVFQNVVIIGLGLIGGSIALELKRKGLAKKVVGVARSAENRREALKRKAVDAAHAEIGDFIAEADLVILATPVKNILKQLGQLKGLVKKNALLTDVGSTKSEIVQAAQRLGGFNFIGGHPIAGTEKSGMKAAELDLFLKRKWILTPTRLTSPSLKNKLYRLVKALRAEPLWMEAGEHDRILAAVSHLPHLLAFSLANTAKSLSHPLISKLAGPSFRSMTRVAESSAEMWTDICLANRKEILRVLRTFEVELAKFKRAIERGDEKPLRETFERGRAFRKKLML